MTRPAFEDDPDMEPPLDPATERLQKKLKRLLGFSSLIMVLGFVAVFAAIAYKLTTRQAATDLDQIAATIAIDADAKVIDMEIIDGRIVVLVTKGEGSALLYLDPATGRQLGRTDFVAR